MNFRELYWRLERFITPGLRSSQQVYAELVDSHVTGETRWLDVGCGHELFDAWIPGQDVLARRAGLIVGTDPDVASLLKHTTIQHRTAALELPFRDDTFSLVTANMVVEHLDDPVAVFRDIRRVLRPGGLFILHTPNVRSWHAWAPHFIPQRIKNRLVMLAEGRPPEDVYPTRYRANTARALRRVATAAGLCTKEIKMLDTSTTSRIMLGPFVIIDLALVRAQRLPALAWLRSNIIGSFEKPATV